MGPRVQTAFGQGVDRQRRARPFVEVSVALPGSPRVVDLQAGLEVPPQAARVEVGPADPGLIVVNMHDRRGGPRLGCALVNNQSAQTLYDLQREQTPWPGAATPVFLVALLALALAKCWVAAHLQLFVDEAAYWQAGRHLAWGYTDLPGLTAWLAALGEGIFGHHYLAVRLPFLLAGTVQPLAVWLLASTVLAPRAARLAALLSLALPLVGSSGLLAAPDAVLNLVTVLMLYAALRALDQPRWWLVAGLCAGLGLLTHFRMAVPLFALGLWALATRRGRAQLRRPEPWLGVVVASPALLPTLLFNLGHDFASFRFQVIERHPWAFNPEGLRQPLEQALATTPGMYLLLLGAAGVLLWQGLRGGLDDRWKLIAWSGLFPVAFYLLVGLFADTKLVTFHWPVPGYLVLLAALPALFGALACRGTAARWLVAAGVALGFVGTLGFLALLGRVAFGPENTANALWRAEEFVGWRAAAERVERLRRNRDEVLIAGNHNLGAELAFELDLPPAAHPYVLDHPRNRRYGRAVQARLWGRDETALAEVSWSAGLLVGEITASPFAARPAQVRAWCRRFGRLELLDELILLDGHKRFLFFRAAPPGSPGSCDQPAFAYLDVPARHQRLSGPVAIRGWAFEDDAGIERVEILVDGSRLGVADYGLPHPGVHDVFPGSTDPNHPRVGFRFSWDPSGLTPGPHRMTVRTVARDGGVRNAVVQPFEIAE